MDNLAHAIASLSTGPFTREQAAAVGLNDKHLQGALWRQVWRGVWVAAGVPDSRELRLAAIRLILPSTAVLCGLTAAWLHGVDVRQEADLDVHVGFPKGRRIRNREGLVVCQETLDAADITVVDGMRVTNRIRTVFDCLRWLKYAEPLVVADAMAHAELVTLDELRAYFTGKRRLRNLRIGERLLDQVEPKSESPMETRLRVVLTSSGLRRPEAQWEVFDRAGHFVGRLDLAYPEARLGVEYDGADHWKQRRADDRRRDAIRATGWEVLVFSADDVFKTPVSTAAHVARVLRVRTLSSR
jgi:very-short-patch-repair endonuclease